MVLCWICMLLQWYFINCWIVSEVEWDPASKKTTFVDNTLPNAGTELEEVYDSALMDQQEYLAQHTFQVLQGLTVDTMLHIKNKLLSIKNVKDIAPTTNMTAKTGRWYILVNKTINFDQLTEIDTTLSSAPKSGPQKLPTLPHRAPQMRDQLSEHTRNYWTTKASTRKTSIIPTPNAWATRGQHRATNTGPNKNNNTRRQEPSVTQNMQAEIEALRKEIETIRTTTKENIQKIQQRELTVNVNHISDTVYGTV